MSKNLKKYSADKIALLALLLLGFLIAQIVTKTRSGIRLSEPISLAQSGLSVRIPKGSDWKSTDWIYSENSFNLLSALSINSKLAASVQWQYHLTQGETAPAEQIRQRSVYYNGQLVETAQKNIGSLVMDWGRIITSGQTGVVFFGIIRLEQYRSVTLEVTQKSGLGDLAKDVFEATAESISFEDNKLLSNGAELMKSFKDSRAADILYGIDIHKYFLIKDEAGQTLGFLAEALAQRQGDDNKAGIEAVSLYNIDGPAGSSEQSAFGGSMFLETFHWVSKIIDKQSSANITTDITLDAQGTVIVHSSIPRRASQFSFGAAAVPEALFELILVEFIDSDMESIVLDLIISRGFVVPAFISKVDLQKDDLVPEDVVYAVKIDFLDKERSYQFMYFDNSKKLLRIDIQGRVNYNVERASKEALIEEFPAWREQILEIDASFKQNVQ